MNTTQADSAEEQSLPKDRYTSALVAVSTDGMSREDWLEHRRQGIGGSDIAAIVGFNKRSSAIDVWMQKLGMKEDEEENEFMEWGNRIEPVIATKFQEEHPEFKVIRRNAILQHPTIPYAFANLDRLVQRKGDSQWGILEIKNVSGWKVKDWTDDAVPLAYQMQVQWYLAVTGLQFAYISPLIGGNLWKEVPIERDEEIITMLLAEAENFWGYVQHREMPPVDGSDASEEALKALYPESEEASTIVLPPAEQTLHAKITTLKSEIKAKEIELALAENQVKQQMGASAAASDEAGNILFTWKSSSTARVDVKRLKAELPDIHAKYSNSTSSRKFLVKEIS